MARTYKRDSWGRFAPGSGGGSRAPIGSSKMRKTKTVVKSLKSASPQGLLKALKKESPFDLRSNVAKEIQKRDSRIGNKTLASQAPVKRGLGAPKIRS